MALNKKLRTVLESLRELEDRRHLVMLANNTPLQKLVCVWPTATIGQNGKIGKAPADDEPVAVRLEWLWDHFDVDWDQLQRAVGIGPDVGDLWNQARYSLLIYPDGTISAHAGKYLTSSAQVAITVPNMGRDRWTPVQPGDDDD